MILKQKKRNTDDNIYENMYIKMFLSYMLLLKEDDGDNDVPAVSDVATASATSPFVSASVVGDDDNDDDDDEPYGPSLLEILRVGNLICLTI